MSVDNVDPDVGRYLDDVRVYTCGGRRRDDPVGGGW
jgi:hypothetical protein